VAFSIKNIRSVKKEKLNKFNSGNKELDHFLKNYALINETKNISKTFTIEEKEKIIGFYTLSAGGIFEDDLETNDKYPKYQLPVIRIARLAVDQKFQKKGIGKKILKYLFTQIIRTSRYIAILGILVDSKKESIGFYKKLGFKKLPLKDKSSSFQPMFINLDIVKKAIGYAKEN